mgnify:CR=1 FL=1
MDYLNKRVYANMECSLCVKTFTVSHFAVPDSCQCASHPDKLICVECLSKMYILCADTKCFDFHYECPFCRAAKDYRVDWKRSENHWIRPVLLQEFRRAVLKKIVQLGGLQYTRGYNGLQNAGSYHKFG